MTLNPLSLFSPNFFFILISSGCVRGDFNNLSKVGISGGGGGVKASKMGFPISCLKLRNF